MNLAADFGTGEQHPVLFGFGNYFLGEKATHGCQFFDLDIGKGRTITRFNLN